MQAQRIKDGIARAAAVALVALGLLAGGGLVAGPSGALAAGPGRPGEEIPSERGEGPTAPAGAGNISSGGEC